MIVAALGPVYLSAMPEARFFKSAAEFRRWLHRNHAQSDELWVGYYKIASGKPSLTWQESVDEALCYGWIDGIRKSIDEVSYKIRFTPRRSKSNWSLVNIKRVRELKKAGRMHESGLTAFAAGMSERRDYSYERHERTVSPEVDAAVRANPRARTFWEKQPPGYKKIASFWIMSAKKEETRARRLKILIDDCTNGKRIGPLAQKSK
jgi:uncharacterized protein YdeI (YjbR/CyaY-like superfamily)